MDTDTEPKSTGKQGDVDAVPRKDMQLTNVKQQNHVVFSAKENTQHGASNAKQGRTKAKDPQKLKDKDPRIMKELTMSRLQTLKILQYNLHKSRERTDSVLNHPDSAKYTILLLQEHYWSTHTKGTYNIHHGTQSNHPQLH